MLAEEPDVRKALVRFREGLGGNLRGAPSLLDLRAACCRAPVKWPNLQALGQMEFFHILSKGGYPLPGLTVGLQHFVLQTLKFGRLGVFDRASEHCAFGAAGL